MTRGDKLPETGKPQRISRNTSGTLTPVPNQPSTPGRSVRLSDELWDGAQEIADEDGVSRSDIVRVALERYIKARRRQRKKKD